MGNKTHAFGTKFEWAGQEVAALNNIGGVEISVDTVDVTAHDSVGGFKEYLVGLMDAGEVPIAGYFDYSDTDGQITMLADCTARETRTARIIFPAATGTVWEFAGLITAIKIGDNPTDDGIPFTATVKVSGKPVMTVSTATGLTGLEITGAILIPAYGAAVKEYVATADASTETVKVTPTAAGVIKVNGSIVASGAASGDISLGDAGSITVVTIVVTENNKASKTYKINVARAAE